MKKLFFLLVFIFSFSVSFAEVNCYIKNDTMFVDFSVDRYVSEFNKWNDKETGFGIVIPDCEKMFKYYNENKKQVKYVYVKHLMSDSEFSKFKSISKKDIRKRKNIMKLYYLFNSVEEDFSVTVYGARNYGRISVTDYAHPINVPIMSAFSYLFIRQHYTCKEKVD